MERNINDQNSLARFCNDSSPVGSCGLAAARARTRAGGAVKKLAAVALDALASRLTYLDEVNNEEDESKNE